MGVISCMHNGSLAMVGSQFVVDSAFILDAKCLHGFTIFLLQLPLQGHVLGDGLLQSEAN